MSKEIYISSTPHETRLAIVEKEELSEIYYERENEYTLAGSIYNGRVTRVLPGMQSAFVDIGLERDAFLYITDFLEEQGEDASEFDNGEPRREARERSGEGRERSGEGRERSGGRGRGERGGRGRGEAAPSETKAAEPEAPLPASAGPVPEATEEGDESADGSRRWRGRRGRRRGGRGGEGRSADAEASPHSERESEGESPEFAEDASAEPLELYGQGEPAAQEPRTEDRPSRGGRGGRGRDRERSPDRGRRPERSRDSSPDTQSGSADSQAESGPAAEPFILPGESLARYRKGEDAAASDPSASVSARPQPTYLTARGSTEVDLSVASWDGGFALPGETLSRHRSESRAPQASVPSGAGSPTSEEPQEAASGDRGPDRRRDRDRKRGRSGRTAQPEATTSSDDANAIPTSYRSGAVMRESLEAHEAVQPGITSGHDPEAGPLSMAAGAFDMPYEAVTDRIERTDPTAELVAAVDAMQAGLNAAAEPPVVQAVEDFHEETHEYEPGEEASASYRVDPSGPSEFRQAGTGRDEDDPAANEAASDAFLKREAEGEQPEFTAVQASGEMLSELPGEVAIPGIPIDPTNPIEHETAVLTARADDLLGQLPTAQPADAGAGFGEGEPAFFAPGAGVLEEELLDDDEDGDLRAVAAGYADDTEEESFEAGIEDPQLTAHLGSLVRDRALDQMTHGDADLLDDEEFDLDDMEEDELDGDDELAASDIAEAEEEELLEADESDLDTDGDKPAMETMGDFPEFAEPRNIAERRPDESGREGRREPRGDRGDRSGRGRDRRGMTGSRGSHNGRGGRSSMQTTDLPAISDLLKPGQELLVQIAKEPIAKKGARITSHIALPGRFLVFMPTVNHVGVSRKIESDGERRWLKEILLSEKGEAAGGFIVRTAASGASEEELRSDLRFLLNLWSDIKQRSEGSKSPALIYHDLNLVERVLRDQVTDNFSAIWCDTEVEYERVLRFLQRFEPSLMRRVKLYTKDTPLFEQFGITEEINKALRSKVWLKSGGSIVINQTEALVAIDINTGKYVGKTARLEDTIVKTNLDAIPEIVRQIRLRDLGGIIVIDFIDMDDRKNRQKVLISLEEELKKDRAPSKVLQFNDFGLVAITRKRVKQSLERTLSITCGICAGTGMVKSPITVCNEIYIELRKMHKQLDKGDVMLRVNPEVVKQLKSNNAKWLQEMEEIAGKTILVKSDPSLHPEQFDIH